MTDQEPLRRCRPVHRYTSGLAYRRPAPHAAAATGIIDHLQSQLAVVDLHQVDPSSAWFARIIRRELKIRGYTRATIKNYMRATISLLRWFGGRPRDLDREYVRDYLEYLVDAHHGMSDVAVQLAAIRLNFDKMCMRDITLGLETPRRPRRKPIVLSREEVRRLMEAAPTMRDTLLIGLMYATGMRVSEVVKTTWADIDFDRNQIFVRQGKGRADRHVQLPQCYRKLLRELGGHRCGDEYLFGCESLGDRRGGRHLSSRTVQRVVRRACQVAGIQKHATPHSLRHAFATHSFEDGCDIRRIQVVLGHVRLETTTIYIRLAKGRTDMPSPLDRLQSAEQPGAMAGDAAQSSPPVGSLRIHTRLDPDADKSAGRPDIQVTLQLIQSGADRFLTGIRCRIARPGFLTIELPPLEQWANELAQLPAAQAARIREPDFYETLRQHLTRRILQAPPPLSSTA